MECRTLGYKVLLLSELWNYDNRGDPAAVSKLMMNAWFRQMKARYLLFSQEDEKSVLDELESLSK